MRYTPPLSLCLSVDSRLMMLVVLIGIGVVVPAVVYEMKVICMIYNQANGEAVELLRLCSTN